MNSSICQLWCLALFIVVTLSEAASESPTVTSSAFTDVSQFNSSFKYRMIWSSQRGSYLRCAAACLKEEHCKYFSYSKETTQCELCNDAIVSTNGERLKYYRRSGNFSCSVEGPLGMEDRRIPDGSITASTYFENRASYAPPRARLNTKESGAGVAGWASAKTSAWIQVDFKLSKVTITGLITQGRGDLDRWVKEFQVMYSDDAQSWDNVTDAHGTQITFPGNKDRNSLVTNRFPVALRTRFLRILTTACSTHCAMRFEVIGCYYSDY